MGYTAFQSLICSPGYLIPSAIVYCKLDSKGGVVPGGFHSLKYSVI